MSGALDGRGQRIMNALIQVVRNASPYLAIELLLPGGSIIAVLLWLFRHRSRTVAGPEIARRWLRSVASRFQQRTSAASAAFLKG